MGMISTVLKIKAYEGTIFFPGLFFYLYIRAPTQKTQKTENPNPKTPNHHKWEKIRKKYKELPWEKYSHMKQG